MNNESLKLLSGLLTKEQLATTLKVSVPTIDKWIRNNKISPVRIGRRVYFNDHSIENLIQHGTDDVKSV